MSFRDDRRRRMKFGEKHEPHEIRDITFQQWNNREYMLSVSANATVCLWETSKNIVTNSIQLPLSGFRFQNIALATTPSAAYQVVIYGSLGQYPLILNVRTENYKSLDVTAMLNGDVHADKIKTCDYLIAFTQPHGNIMHIATSMGHLIALQIQNKSISLLAYQLISSSTHQLIYLFPHQLINLFTHQRINVSTYQLINSSTYQRINSSTYQLINLFTYQRINPIKMEIFYHTITQRVPFFKIHLVVF